MSFYKSRFAYNQYTMNSVSMKESVTDMSNMKYHMLGCKSLYLCWEFILEEIFLFILLEIQVHNKKNH